MSFEYLGCAGDWPANDPLQDSITRQDSASATVFLVRHPATCGLEASNPSYSINGSSLTLSYEMQSPQDAVLMCDCDYRARFTFTDLPAEVRKVSFMQAGHER